jgi:hypothetical protein
MVPDEVQVMTSSPVGAQGLEKTLVDEDEKSR